MQQKPGRWYRQSGVIPYRRHSQNSTTTSCLNVLLITSRKRKRWVIPKGIIEPGMLSWESAAKEAFEEAGVKGIVSDTALGVYTYRKWGGMCEVEVFPMQVMTVFEEWPEDGIRARKWMSIDEAIPRMREEVLQSLFKRLPEIVFTGKGG